MQDDETQYETWSKVKHRACLNCKQVSLYRLEVEEAEGIREVRTQCATCGDEMLWLTGFREEEVDE